MCGFTVGDSGKVICLTATYTSKEYAISTVKIYFIIHNVSTVTTEDQCNGTSPYHTPHPFKSMNNSE